MFPNNKIIEIFSICDDFSKIFDKTLEQNAIPNCDGSKKRKYHRDGMMSDSEVMTILILFHDSVILRKCSIIETINDELKDMAQVEHSRHRSFHNFVNNLMSGLAAYCFFPKKPMLRLEREIDNQLTIF
ncbi:MAG: transposase [bacterium]|nr:transposase [bacterium]